jgi:hypothetical protein
MKTRRQAFAAHTGMSIEETKDYRYHYGRTTAPVWSIDNSYYCVTKPHQKPATHRDGMQWDWVKLTDNYCAAYGFEIWISN